MNQFQRALTCITLLAVTGIIGVGALTTVAVKLRLVTPSAALCKAKFWVHQECEITARNTESETVTVNGSAMEETAQRLPENVQAEQSRENSNPVAETAQQETAVKETHYNVASAQAAVPESAPLLPVPTAAAAGGKQAVQPVATDSAPPSKQPTTLRATQQPNRGALGKRNDQKKSKLVGRETLRDVSVNSPDGMQRRIDIHPTSLQDVYYYSAPR